MIKRIIPAILFLPLLFSCNGNKSEETKTIEDIRSAQEKFYSQTEAEDPDLELAKSIISDIDMFVLENPDHEEAPELLYDAGRIYANYFHNYIESIDYYNKVHTDYPEFRKAPDALFTEAYFYETQLNDNSKAKKLYSEFLEKYPDHELADDAKFSLDNLGRSAEDIYQDIMKKQENKDSVSVQ